MKIELYTADLAKIYYAVKDHVKIPPEDDKEIYGWICKMANLKREFNVSSIKILCNYVDENIKNPDLIIIVNKWKTNYPCLKETFHA